MYRKQCLLCGKTFGAKSKNRKYCSKKCKHEAIQRHRKKNEQLCWECKRATGGCTWSDKLLPVEGWDATPTIIKDSEIGEIPSFQIKHCPQFVWG